ncbi:hypothetical protein K461DRAFT_280078 [Myriangium duriaei CBS 260.36]|uniref:Anaphase-promoting complex subunit CDC26 n=1 Tax=Myriangium duriaei CBS 260.36 TaxID=1168546 RepID=A0A9P4IYI3_9PEZI|nr:hypothetical protein K461DRAFT_280078 [Myriangium duriaei CBS 260.36]
MLRREPTKITLTMEDVANYDAVKAQKDQQKRRQEQYSMAANDPFATASGQNSGHTQRSKEQRIGVSNSRH